MSNAGNIKKITAFVLSIVLFFVLDAYIPNHVAQERPSPTSEFYVNDFSNVLTQETKAFITSEGKKLNDKTGAQVVVVTIPDTKEVPLSDYALTLARTWGIGQKDKDNGVLLIFTTKEPHAWILAGDGLEGALPSGRCGEILNTWAVREINNKEWNRGIVNTFRAVSEQVYLETKADVPREIALTHTTAYKNVQQPTKVNAVDAAAAEPGLYDKVFDYMYDNLLFFLPEEGKLAVIGLLFLGLLCKKNN